jgi:hypothetical protein
MPAARVPSAPTIPAARWTRLGDLRAAVDRHIGDDQALQPGQALTEQEAVRAATVTAAASLGLPADLVICTGHPFAPGARTAQTRIAGQQAWPPQAGGHQP